MESVATVVHHEPWNKGKIVGQKAPFKVKEIWALRVRLQMESRVRELAGFNLGIDSKLRACNLVSLKVRDICHGDHVASRATVMQHKTQRPVQFEITPATRDAVQKWIKLAALKSDAYLFPSRGHGRRRRRRGGGLPGLRMARRAPGNQRVAQRGCRRSAATHGKSCSRPSSGWMVAARSTAPTFEVGRLARPAASDLGSARSMRLHYG